ncbi:MAG TPA: Hsp20/alpha crystallin family protein [Candidatus Cybelea sp.]|jgi:HSP20 family protein|nr:Hsp20/alpha crystallin family protein [Candidatus Cybelea sp.]
MEFLVGPRLGAFTPNADVFVDDDARRLVVVIEVAGADPESLRLVFDERSLVIGGRRREAAPLRSGSFAQKEIAHGEFAKRIPLPVAIEYDRIVASYEDGYLIVLAPISATAYLPTTRTELHILVKRTHS